MGNVRGIMDRLQEAKRQPKDEASKSYVLLAAVQAGLEKALKGWKLNIEGVRGGDRSGGKEETSDDFTLYAYGPNRDSVMVSSSNDAEQHIAHAQVIGEKRIKKTWDRVERGYAKQIVAWVLDAIPKAGVMAGTGHSYVAGEEREGAQRTVRDLAARLDETEADFQYVIANTGINGFGVPRAMKEPSSEPRTWSAKDLSGVVKWLVKTFGSSAGAYKLNHYNTMVGKQVMLLRRKVEAQRVGGDEENPLVQQLKNYEVMWQAYSSAIDKVG